MTQDFSIKGNIVDIKNKRVFAAELAVENGRIKSIIPVSEAVDGFITPGFVDAHVHVESSMLIPSEFARMAVVHGTVGTVSDPHEIANVCGMEGVRFMIDNGKQVPFKFNFGAPSCVPATGFETAGAVLDSNDVETLLKSDDIKYLSEMMNFPGVLFGDEEVHRKIALAKQYNKPVDGHAPGLRGEDARKYIAAGISTDHECFTADEALDKLNHGMKILVREGSAAKNFDALAVLLDEHYRNMMFCCDDKHPDSLLINHINDHCARAVALGVDAFKVLEVACVNPVEHYKLDIGLLQEGDPADFIILEDLVHFKVKQTYINGQLVADNGVSLIAPVELEAETLINNFSCSNISVADLALHTNEYPVLGGDVPVIEALDGQLITNRLLLPVHIQDDELVSDPANDILKIVVVNRYNQAPVAKSFIKNFGLKAGAIASSVAHDSHNIVAVGINDTEIAAAVNLVIAAKGGLSAVDTSKSIEHIISLPIAGLMTAENGYAVAEKYTIIDLFVKEQLGSTLRSPFMTLSFMALLVIPHLKLSDKGLFDGDSFSFVNEVN
ncbi:adenine deaminase [Polluticaenibacter yanchengensis]|uniref:Adenine deaminase n=1 Tax=Polluticaenibacter yanchengensis TaxID=3014562 RepID=A0ABT4UJU2_9BACT|nr:adenine deaminase [Chitinophagaceae bacterium LY-5]